MDTSIMYCICGASVDQHAGKDHPFVEKRAAYNPATWPRELGGRLLDYSAPGALYIQVEDRLRILVYASVAGIEVDVSLRLLEGNKNIVPMRNQYFPTTVRALNTFDVDLTEGYLLDVCVSTPTAGVRRGACFVVLELIRGSGAVAYAAQCLLADYLVSNNALSWPAGRINQGAESAGLIRSISGGTPAAGADIAESVSTGARWQFLYMRASLTTSATVATRIARFQLDDGANINYVIGNNVGQTAGTTVAYIFANGLQFNNDGNATIAIPCPSTVFLAAGYRIKTSTLTLQAGDQWTAPQYSVIEWLES